LTKLSRPGGTGGLVWLLLLTEEYELRWTTQADENPATPEAQQLQQVPRSLARAPSRQGRPACAGAAASTPGASLDVLGGCAAPKPGKQG
jgi:hypothetical protein